MKKDIFFRNGSIKYLSKCDMWTFFSWLQATMFPLPFFSGLFSLKFANGSKGQMYRTAVLAELKRRVEVLS